MTEQVLKEGDYVLPEEEGVVWITVRNISVEVRVTDEGVITRLYPKGLEANNELGQAFLFFDEAQEELELDEIEAPEDLEPDDFGFNEDRYESPW